MADGFVTVFKPYFKGDTKTTTHKGRVNRLNSLSDPCVGF